MTKNYQKRQLIKFILFICIETVIVCCSVSISKNVAYKYDYLLGVWFENNAVAGNSFWLNLLVSFKQKKYQLRIYFKHAF